MDNNLEIINFLQDFGCARLKHLQILYNKHNDNFNNILTNNIVSKKGDIFVYNNATIDNKMLIALDILCKYNGKIYTYKTGYRPICISFLSKDKEMYHIIVADENNEYAVVKQINNPSFLPEADKYILAFRDASMLEHIKVSHSYLYCIYPSLETIKQVP